MSNIGVTYNNPGNLTVTGPGVFAYGGQTGVYSSPNGMYYAEFGDPTSGSSALQDYISNNIGTNANTSENTLQSFLGYYLNGNSDFVANTAANPYATGYLSGVSKALGLSPDQPFTQAQVNSPTFVNSLGAAIAQQEGTASVYNGGASTGNAFSNTVWNLDTWINNNVPGVNQWFASNGGGNNMSAQPQTSAASSGGLFGPLIDWFNTEVKVVEGGVGAFLARGGFVLVGLILLGAGIFYLAASNKTVQQVAVAAA